jgi:hypothetical protein
MADFNSKDLVKIAVDTYKGRVMEYSKEQGENTVRNAFINILGVEKPTPRQFRRHQVEIFEIIEDVLSQTITDGFATPFFDQFVETRDIALGDEERFYVEDNTKLVVSRVAGSHWDLRRQKLNIGDTFTVETHAYGAAIYTDFIRFITGRIDWNAFINKVADAFKDQIQNLVYTEFLDTINYLPSQFKVTASYADADLLTLAAHVQAANQNSSIVIAGTKVALSKLTNIQYLSDGEKAALNQNGVVGVWNSYKTLPIVQSHTPGTFNFQISDDELFIMPSDAKPVKLVHEGDPMINEVSDGNQNLDQSLEYKFIDRYGVATVFNTLYGIYNFSA